MNTKECADALQKEISKIYIGKTKEIKLVIMAVLAGGHILLDDLPGSGKTTLIKTLSRALGCSMNRIQFTPDLLPSDIIGTTVFDRNTSEFRALKGPVFTNILLADEINRAIPRTQSALLEAMEEKQVTFDNCSYKLEDPFLVMATENPVERESTFALPAAQLDRFFIRTSLGFPDRSEEIEMLKKSSVQNDFDCIEKITDADKLSEIKKEIEDVHVSDNITEYIVDLIHRTRKHPDLKYGASPRASKSLFLGGKCMAAMNGRDYVIPEDIQEIFIPVINHRVIISNEARYTGKKETEILRTLLSDTPVPPYKEDLFARR